MRNISKKITALCMAATLALLYCVPVSAAVCTITYFAGEGETFTVEANTGDKLVEPAPPEKEGCVFRGWYADPTFTSKIDFDTYTVAWSTTFYAKYLKTVDDTVIPGRAERGEADQVFTVPVRAYSSPFYYVEIPESVEVTQLNQGGGVNADVETEGTTYGYEGTYETRVSQGTDAGVGPNYYVKVVPGKTMSLSGTYYGNSYTATVTPDKADGVIFVTSDNTKKTAEDGWTTIDTGAAGGKFRYHSTDAPMEPDEYVGVLDFDITIQKFRHLVYNGGEGDNVRFVNPGAGSAEDMVVFCGDEKLINGVDYSVSGGVLKGRGVFRGSDDITIPNA